MIREDMNDLTDVERNAVPVGKDLQELKVHGNLEFPVMVYPVTLSQMYLKLIRWHWHPEIEMIYMLEGKVEALVDEESIILTPDQGIFINQNVLHSFCCIEGHEAVFFSVVFHPALIFGYGSASLSVKYLSPISENPNMKYVLLNDDDPYTAPLIESMKQVRTYYSEGEYGYELACKAAICQLWNQLLKIPCDTSNMVIKSKRIINDEQRIKDAILYIEKHFADPITLDDIAGSIHISKSECCRCFQRVLRQTPFEYLLKYRIFHAAKLIQHQDPNASSISNLAITVGFGNISYFNKVFKRYLHITPTEYKRIKCAAPPDKNLRELGLK